MRRALLALALLAAACGPSAAPADRLAAAADAMERLRGVRFSLDATSEANMGLEPLTLRYVATGELVPPDRLRLTVTEPTPATLVIVGTRAWRDGRPAPAAALRTLAHPLALIEQAREAGTVTVAGLGFSRGLTQRYRIDRGDRGVVEVELGLGDGLIHRQTFAVSETAELPDAVPVRTTYVVEYWDFGSPLEVGEPN